MEVFPTLHLEGDCKVYMEDVRVDRVVTTRARDLLKVYISCDNIIEKEYIYKVEKELHKQERKLYYDRNYKRYTYRGYP